MISVAKYNEIMEHIEVTEEMRERILSNIAQKRKRRRITQIVRIVSAAAACFAVVFGAAYYLKTRPELPAQQPPVTETTTMPSTSTIPVQTSAVTTTEVPKTTFTVSMQTTVTTNPNASANPLIECKSAAELRQTMGIPIYDVKSVPFRVTETSYINGGNFAEISYFNDNDLCCIRVSMDETDQSGFCFDEETVKIRQIEVDGVPVTLTTDIEGTYLASWMQDGRFHSVGLIAKNNAQTILPIVSEILAQKPDVQ